MNYCVSDWRCAGGKAGGLLVVKMTMDVLPSPPLFLATYECKILSKR
jgi:hypothetical protein